MKKTVLITGASSGIGMELAKIHARKGDNLVLVARNMHKLNELKSELEVRYKTEVVCIGKDLSKTNAALEVYNEVHQKGIEIEYLVNNAGFGDFGMFAEADWKKTEDMIHLNITSLTHFTKLFVGDMIKRGSGKIMNVASTAAFQPGPVMAVYYATKAYVLSFSQAIDNELRPLGISVTALCPGPTASGFQDASAMKESKLVIGKKLPTSKKVAEFGYMAMMKGKAVAIHGLMNSFLAFAVRFAPRSLVVKMARKMTDK